MKSILSRKWASTGITVAAVVLAGSIATASAHQDPNHGQGGSGYTKDQCRDGGWKMFKKPNGSPMFKNQDQCTDYFQHGGKDKDKGHDRDDHRKKGHHSRWDDFKSFCGRFFHRH